MWVPRWSLGTVQTAGPFSLKHPHTLPLADQALAPPPRFNFRVPICIWTSSNRTRTVLILRSELGLQEPPNTQNAPDVTTPWLYRWSPYWSFDVDYKLKGDTTLRDFSTWCLSSLQRDTTLRDFSASFSLLFAVPSREPLPNRA